MRLLSATEAISPAIEHAKALLRPFSLKLWLKIGLVAMLAEMGAQFIFPPFGGTGGHTSSQSSGITAIAGGISALHIIIIAVIGVILFLFGLVLLYFGSRMQLVLMDLVATRTTQVAPAWHRTASRTWRWIGLKVAFFLALFVVMGAILIVPIIYFVRSMPANGTQQQVGAGFFATFALFFVAIFFAIFIIMAALWILRDFVLPFILFDDATLGTALRNTSIILRREPGSVLFYLLIKFILSLVAGIAAELCIFFAVLIAAIPLGLIGGILWFALHQAGPLGTAIMYIGFALLGAIALTVFFVVAICIAGAVLTFYQTYALYFVGGRIPNLGNLLEPPPPPIMQIPQTPFAPA
jgi:hypothetical protein